MELKVTLTERQTDTGHRVRSLKHTPPWMTPEAETFRTTVREFVDRYLTPHQARWAEQGYPDLTAWMEAGKAGLLLSDVPGKYGGAGANFAHDAVLVEELARADVNFGFSNHSIVAKYILAYGTEEQKQQWLPRMASGEIVGAIAMTESDCGSDLKSIKTTATRDDDAYVINGSKAFITNGLNAGIVCVAVRTDRGPVGLKGLSLIIVETRDLQGYRVGRPVAKIGRAAVDVCELVFENARVPAENLLGASEGRGLFQMMDQLSYERLVIGISAISVAERAVDITTRFVKKRRAFGKAVFDLQNARFKLAECKTEAHVGRVFIDHCIEQFIAGRLNAVTAAMAKYWLTECQCRVVDECLQLHGGRGYLQDNPIARMWADGRVQRIYAGVNEVMKEVVGTSL